MPVSANAWFSFSNNGAVGERRRLDAYSKIEPGTIIQLLRHISSQPTIGIYPDSVTRRGRDLYWWHPLVSGDPDTVHTAGISVRGKVGASEEEVPDEDLEGRIVGWPVRMPKAARRKA